MTIELRSRYADTQFALHKLWTDMITSPWYDKSAWKLLSNAIDRLAVHSARAIGHSGPDLIGATSVTPAQLVSDETYETFTPTREDGAIVGEEIAARLPAKGEEPRKPLAVFNVAIGATTDTRVILDLSDDEQIVLRYLVFVADPDGDPLKDIYEVLCDRDRTPGGDKVPPGHWYEALKTLQAKLRSLPPPKGEC